MTDVESLDCDFYYYPIFLKIYFFYIMQLWASFLLAQLQSVCAAWNGAAWPA